MLGVSIRKLNRSLVEQSLNLNRRRIMALCMSIKLRFVSFIQSSFLLIGIIQACTAKGILFWGMVRTGIVISMIGSQLFEMMFIRLYSHIDVGCSIIAFNTLQLEFNLSRP